MKLLGHLKPKFGFREGAPKTYQEMVNWRKAGLIDFSDTDLVDATVADMLLIIRERLAIEIPVRHEGSI